MQYEVEVPLADVWLEFGLRPNIPETLPFLYVVFLASFCRLQC